MAINATGSSAQLEIANNTRGKSNVGKLEANPSTSVAKFHTIAHISKNSLGRDILSAI